MDQDQSCLWGRGFPGVRWESHVWHWFLLSDSGWILVFRFRVLGVYILEACVYFFIPSLESNSQVSISFSVSSFSLCLLKACVVQNYCSFLSCILIFCCIYSFFNPISHSFSVLLTIFSLCYFLSCLLLPSILVSTLLWQPFLSSYFLCIIYHFFCSKSLQRFQFPFQFPVFLCLLKSCVILNYCLFLSLVLFTLHSIPFFILSLYYLLYFLFSHFLFWLLLPSNLVLPWTTIAHYFFSIIHWFFRSESLQRFQFFFSVFLCLLKSWCCF